MPHNCEAWLEARLPRQRFCLFRGQGQGSLCVEGALPWLSAVSGMKPCSPGITTQGRRGRRAEEPMRVQRPAEAGSA